MYHFRYPLTLRLDRAAIHWSIQDSRSWLQASVRAPKLASKVGEEYPKMAPESLEDAPRRPKTHLKTDPSGHRDSLRVSVKMMMCGSTRTR